MEKDEEYEELVEKIEGIFLDYFEKNDLDLDEQRDIFTEVMQDITGKVVNLQD